MTHLLTHRILPSTLLLVLAAAGCATDDRPANVLAASRLDGDAPVGEGGLLVYSWLPDCETFGLRIDGNDLIWEGDDGWHYADFLGVGNGLGAWLPAGGHQIEIIDDDGNVVASTAADVPDDPLGNLYTQTFFWSEEGHARSWTFVPSLAPDPDVVSIDLKSTVAEPVVIERCVGSFDPQPCEPVATVAAGGEWHSTMPVGPSSADGVGEIYLQARLVGSSVTSELGSTRPEACREQGYFLPAEIMTFTGPGATPDMRAVAPQPTCY
jgi:hypothetical protein